VISFGNEKKETKPGTVIGSNAIWGDQFILKIEDAFDFIEITVFSGKLNADWLTWSFAQSDWIRAPSRQHQFKNQTKLFHFRCFKKRSYREALSLTSLSYAKNHLRISPTQ